ncbi:MAG: alpha/beta hydrolase [Proteobacteria bacterium]|nr:alpha/beta hydrolase [Pseudomonadota bacterium]
MFSLIAIAVGVYMGIVGALYLIQDKLIYHPSQYLPPPAESGLPEMRPLQLTTKDGLKLTSWYKAAEKGQPTMVYFQGNGGNIAGREIKVRTYLDAGFGVLLVGYRGYGGNPGTPSEQGLYADGRAQLEFLAGQGIKPGRWVLYGESLGTGIAVQLAFEQAPKGPVGAVVLESPFTSLADAAAEHYPFVPARMLIKDRYDSLAKIDRIMAPLFVFAGENDMIIPPRHGKTLFEAARQPKESHWIPGGGHNNLHQFGIPGKVIDFLRRRLSGG